MAAGRRGRASLFSEALAVVILARLAAGESLRSICRDDGMPDESTVRGWVIDDRREADADADADANSGAADDAPGFAARYARARDIGLDCMADELLAIADDGSNDWQPRAKRDGSVDAVIDHEHVSRSKLRVDVRKWYLSKLAPKRYGERIAVDARHVIDPETASWLGQRG